MTSTITKPAGQKQTRLNGGGINPSGRDFTFNIRNYVNYTRFLITSITLMFTLAGGYYAFFLTPKYQATVLLSSKIYGSLSANSLSTDKIIPVDDKDTSAPRQLVLIQTQKILRLLVEKMQLDLKIASNTPGASSSALSLGSFSIPPALNKSDIVITFNGNNTYNLDIPILGFSANGAIGSNEEYLLPSGDPLTINIKHIAAPAGAVFTLNKIPLGEAVNNLTDNLVFDAPGMENKLVTNIISIAYTGMDPKRVTETVNMLADIAVDLSKEQERKEAAYMTELLEIQKNQILDLLNKKGEELAVVNMELGHVAYDEKVYGKVFGDELTQLNNNIALAQADLAKLSQTVTDKNVLYLAAAATYNSLVERRTALEELVNKSVVSSSSLLDLQRDLDVYTLLYQDVSKNLEQFRARLAEPIGDLRIVEYACVPDTPSSLARPVIILLSVIVGLISGYVVALVFD